MKKENSNYIVRQPIRNAQKQTIGYEILYCGENLTFDETGAGKEFAAADTVYNFLTQNTGRALRGSLNFMTFTPTLMMKRTPVRAGHPDRRQRDRPPRGAGRGAGVRRQGLPRCRE